MSNSKSPPDYLDNMRDLFDDSEDETFNNSGQQSLGPSTHEASGELEQTNTKRKHSEDEANFTSLNNEDQEDLVYFLIIMLSSAPDSEIESGSKEASSKLRHQSKPSIRKIRGKKKA